MGFLDDNAVKSGCIQGQKCSYFASGPSKHATLCVCACVCVTLTLYCLRKMGFIKFLILVNAK